MNKSILATYAKGKKRNIRTYTVCQESKYLIIKNVPEFNLLDEIRTKLEEFGELINCRYFDQSSTERKNPQDTIVAEYKLIDSAR